jgi:hypothetical protein
LQACRKIGHAIRFWVAQRFSAAITALFLNAGFSRCGSSYASRVSLSAACLDAAERLCAHINNEFSRQLCSTREDIARYSRESLYETLIFQIPTLVYN